MKKFGKAAAILFLIISCVAIIAGLYLADALPDKFSYRITDIVSRFGSSHSSSEENSEPTDDETNTDSAIQEIKVSENKLFSGHSYSVYLDLTNDLTADPSDYASILNEADEYFNYYLNFNTDTVFIKPDIQKKYADSVDASSNQLDILREYMLRASDYCFKCVLVADYEMISGEDGLSFEIVNYYLSNYDFNGILLITDGFENDIFNTVNFMQLHLSAAFSGKPFGISANTTDIDNVIPDEIDNVIQNGLCSFVVINADYPMNSSTLPFATVLGKWNAEAALYDGIDFICMHRCDRNNSGESGWRSNSECVEQLVCLWDYDRIDGSLFYNSRSLRENKSSFAQRIAYHLSDGEYKDLTVKRINVDSESNTVTFTGVSAAGHKLYCNNSVLNPNGGSFSEKFPLTAGENEFTFFSCGKDITYRVYNNSHLINSYYPDTDINAAKDETITIYAVCISQSNVFCSLNGKEYRMYPDSGAELSNTIPEGYSVYSCGINFKSNSYNDINLGNIKITAECGDNKESVTCGRVTLLKSNTNKFMDKVMKYIYTHFYKQSEELDVYTEYTEDKGISPYKDNGLGNSLMCRIIYDSTERLGTPGEYNTYHPVYSTLCEGTLDYVNNMTISEEGYIRYELSSGIAVYGVNCELINNAFVMPDNRIIVNRVDDSKTSSTDLIFDTDWMVPVTVLTAPQTFKVGYKNYNYNITDYTAEYVDITFYHTSEFYNLSALVFADNSPLGNCELYKDTNGNMIVRIHLKQRGQFYGFNVSKNENGQLVVSFKKHVDGSIAGKVIMLDPGHGGLSMTGTALSDNTVAESEVTLKIANKLKSLLEQQGATVLITRTKDTPLVLSERTSILLKYNPDLFLSVHCDGSENRYDSGTHTFYFRPYSQPLAKAINENLSAVYREHIYSPGDTNYSSIDRGIKYYPFFVTRTDNCPSVLIETGFMTNYTEGQLLIDDNIQYWIAQGICNGVAQYFENNH